MKIIDFQIGSLKIPLKKPFKTALRTAYFAEDIVIKLTSDCGLVGYGSCTPTPKITGDTKGSIIEALQLIKGRALDFEWHGIEKILEKISAGFIRNSSALSCFDIAVHDLFCQKLKIPLYQFLGGEKNTLFTSLTISCNEVDVMINDALQAVDTGFFDLKLKVGLDPDNDYQRIFEVAHAVGPKIKLRVDANQGWTPKQAVHILNQCESKNISLELIEQPVPAKNLKGLRFIKDHVQTKILADEAVFSPEDALEVCEKECADMINIKLAKAGGIHQAEKIHIVSQSSMVESFVGCMLESPIAVLAAAHFAAGKKHIMSCDLDPPFLIEKNPVESPVTFDGNTITLDENVPGLGITHVHDFEIIP